MSILENSNGDTARRHMAPARAAPLQSGMVFIKHAAPSLLMQWLQQGRFPIYRGYKPAEKNNKEMRSTNEFQ